MIWNNIVERCERVAKWPAEWPNDKRKRIALSLFAGRNEVHSCAKQQLVNSAPEIEAFAFGAGTTSQSVVGFVALCGVPK